MAYKNTNVGGIGSQADLHARLQAAGKEKEWASAGKAPGLCVWRIEKFHVVPWPLKSYGCFYNGDSYIVMNTYKRGAASFGWDIHFWLGQNTSQDEAGTAAYKTVELDDFLGGGPVEYREVQGFESSKFINYFGGKITILEGGIESGFRHVTSIAKPAVLLWVKGGRRHIQVKDVPVSRESLNSGDVFVLATNDKIIQWNGSKASAFEKTRGEAICHTLQSAHTGFVHSICIEENDGNPDFWGPLGGRGSVKPAYAGGRDEEIDQQAPAHNLLFKLSDASGSLKFTQVGSGKLHRKLLTPDDVFVLDVGTEVFAWIGRGSSANERRNAMHYAQRYLVEHSRPEQLSIARVVDGNEPDHFWSAFEFA